MTTAQSFLKALHQEVANHPGVGHSLLGRMTIDPRDRLDFKIFGGQHYPLVGFFTRYMEILLLRAPSSKAKVWIAKVLVDEYGDRSDDQDHVEHYQIFMRACGWESHEFDTIKLHPAICGFIQEHLRMCSEEPFLVGLGAIGPGHEWAIPTMFDYCIKGLRGAGLSEADIGYFTLHTEQDIDHAAWLEEALELFATTDEERQQIRRGCLLSLEARERFWWGMTDKINAARISEHLPSAISSSAQSIENELTLREFRSYVHINFTLPPTKKSDIGTMIPAEKAQA